MNAQKSKKVIVHARKGDAISAFEHLFRYAFGTMSRTDPMMHVIMVKLKCFETEGKPLLKFFLYSTWVVKT